METVFRDRMQCHNCLYIRSFINQSIDKIKSNYSLDAGNVYEIKLILNELISNAFIHGNKRNSMKYIELSIEEVNQYLLKICVSDQGEGWDYRNMLDEFDSDRQNQMLDEHGRGLLIVSNLCESIVFNEKGNQVEIVKRIQQ